VRDFSDIAILRIENATAKMAKMMKSGIRFTTPEEPISACLARSLHS
jgi:hypothetical protein